MSNFVKSREKMRVKLQIYENDQGVAVVNGALR